MLLEKNSPQYWNTVVTGVETVVETAPAAVFLRSCYSREHAL